ncbi:hypothetical protein EC991_009992 [Linnemannia zychae]|nr:hypothetical protein EC991_009992 [Linnemannia zychae]
MATALRKAFSQATITATRAAGTTPSMATTQPRSVLCCHRAFSALSFHSQENNTRHQNHRNRKDRDHSDDIFDRPSPLASSSRSAKTEYNGDPELYRIFFRSPDKMRSLEEAQVFINHIKSSYGPLTQYQFARCPETKKYFGYGFMTFKNKDSLDKALNDAYIRVGMKDFELIRSENNNRNRRPIRHKNTGFSGFHDLEELRAMKLNQQSELEKQQRPVSEIKAVEEGEVLTERDSSNGTVGDEFVSALPSSSTTTTTASTDNSNSTTSPTDSSPSVSKPYFVPLQKKGRAQLWKLIPDELERAEQSSKQADDSDEEVSVPKVDSKKLAADLVGDILNSKP